MIAFTLVRNWRAVLLPTVALTFLLVGLAFLVAGMPGRAHLTWFAGLVLGGAPVVYGTVRGALRGHLAADLVATLSIVTSAVLQHPLPGLIVVLMQTGGEGLERYAAGRASRAVRELEDAAPRLAHRLIPADGDGAAGVVEDVEAEEVRAGDLLLVRPGELVPCDGIVTEGRSHVDTARITGEPMPRTAVAGSLLLSGFVNGDAPLTMRATRPATESQYARIVELVRRAQESKAPLQRIADRYAVWFTPLTLLVAGVAYLLTGDPMRILAVLVVATPCPLILATPVAIIGGINRLARHQIVARTGGALEALARVNVAVFDKTGTLTVGVPRVARVLTPDGATPAELLRLAGGLELHSGHLLGRAVVDAALLLGQPLPAARDVVESPGRGLEGEVDGRRVVVGAPAYVQERSPASETLGAIDPEEGMRAWIAVDGSPGGVLCFDDVVRPGLQPFFHELAHLGVRRTIILSGDHTRQAEAVAEHVGVDEVRGDLLPEDKVAAVRALVDEGMHVMMVGDGTNDAPALSAASVGVALAAHGGGITAEAADIVLLVDDPTRIADALRIGRSTLRIARQSIVVGLGLSVVGMLFAAVGMLPPTAGALAQEAIDVAVIINALRASRG